MLNLWGVLAPPINLTQRHCAWPGRLHPPVRLQPERLCEFSRQRHRRGYAVAAGDANSTHDNSISAAPVKFRFHSVSEPDQAAIAQLQAIPETGFLDKEND